MKFCNNCGNELLSGVKFCNQCGVPIKTVVENKVDSKNIESNINYEDITYNGIYIDIQELKHRHGNNKINAIKELRDRTNVTLKEAKNIIEQTYKFPFNKTDGNKKESIDKNDNIITTSSKIYSFEKMHVPVREKRIIKSANETNSTVVGWIMVMFLIVFLYIIKVPLIDMEIMTSISIYALLATILFLIWLFFSLILKKDRKIPRIASIVSFITFIVSVVVGVGGLKSILLVGGLYLINKYIKIKTKKQLEQLKLREENEHLEEEKRLEEIRIREEKERIEEQNILIEKELRLNMIDKGLDLVFSHKDMVNRLKEFVLEHTKKYDYTEIDIAKYLNKLDMFAIYINNKIEGEIRFPDSEEINELKKYWDNQPSKSINKYILQEYIDKKKQQIYTNFMNSILDIDDSNMIEEVVIKYLDIYGENGLNALNISTLSDVLGESYDDISEIVSKEYKRIKDDYKMKKLENSLFKSSANHKDLDYIDSLSGFDFEDYLGGLLVEFGYKTKELPYSNDYGADLIISKGFNEIVIQAKNYIGNVGNKAVQEVIAAKSHYKCDIGMVITNAYYTQNAIKTAEASEIILVDRDGLERIINEGSIYFNSLVS